MKHLTKAVIFDMDGVLIDSEPLWRRAMIKGFSEFGVNFTEDDCRSTTGMRLNEVILHWQKVYPSKLENVDSVNKSIIDHLIELINKEGKALDGLLNLLDYLKTQQILIGLATSSDELLMTTILDKLNISHFFNAKISAQYLTYGKPHPLVYLECANALKTEANHCLVIEDSINGIIAGKAAQMKVIAIPDAEQVNNVKFNVADAVIAHLNQVKDFIILN